MTKKGKTGLSVSLFMQCTFYSNLIAEYRKQVKIKQEDLRSCNRAYKDLTVLLALHSQRSAHSNSLLDDSLITVHTTSIIASLLSAVVKSLKTYWSCM